MRRLEGNAPRAALSGYKEAIMGKRGEKRERRSAILEPDAAGIDIGAEEIYVAVPPDRDEQATRRFSSFTCDLYALADWLERCRIRTVAMESTGVYWIPLFQILEERGFKVYLVNAHSLKTVPGRKSDVSDCEWIQYLHSVGLLKASFRPPEDICAVRTLWRHRGSLLQMAAEHTQHMQKSLSLMNLQIHHVLSDITGASGLSILDAILAGNRDPLCLAHLCNIRVKSPRETVAQALVGDYRPEHLFTLKQSLDGYRYYQKLIAELDDEIARLMHTLPNATEHPSPIPKRTKRTAYQRMGNDPLFDLRSELYRIAGVDLTDIPGVSAIAAQVVLTEVGPDVSRFRNASAFASWLGLCPDKRISGGKVLSTKTRKVKNRVALVLRLGAKSLSRAKDYFGAFFRRMRARLGTAQAITATAHKLARVVYHVLHSKEPYTETVFHRCDEQEQQRAEMRLRKHAALLGFQLLPISTNSAT
jgi:transposase